MEGLPGNATGGASNVPFTGICRCASASAGAAVAAAEAAAAAAAALFLALLLPAFLGGPTVGREYSMEGEEEEMPKSPTTSVEALTAVLSALEGVDLAEGKGMMGGET